MLALPLPNPVTRCCLFPALFTQRYNYDPASDVVDHSAHLKWHNAIPQLVNCWGGVVCMVRCVSCISPCCSVHVLCIARTATCCMAWPTLDVAQS